MEDKDSEQKVELAETKQTEQSTEEKAAEKVEAATENDAEDDKKKDAKEEKKSVKNFVFKECPETSGFTPEQLETENCKTLDPISHSKVIRPLRSYNKRVRISTFYQEGSDDFLNTEIKVCGWAKTCREAAKGAFYFVELNDGSCVGGIQVVVDQAIANFASLQGEGVSTSFAFVGTLIESPKPGQKYELQVNDNTKHSMTIFGKCPQGEYPLSKKKHTKEFLRDIMHLRSRTNLISIVARLRNSLSIATHEYFQKRGFLYVHTPMITASDCEGAGEMFQVTTILPDKELPITELKTTKDGKIDYTNDFFKKPAFLTVSGQLNVEGYC